MSKVDQLGLADAIITRLTTERQAFAESWKEAVEARERLTAELAAARAFAAEMRDFWPAEYYATLGNILSKHWQAADAAEAVSAAQKAMSNARKDGEA